MRHPKLDDNRQTKATTVQKIPSTGPAREALREKGQFWTPDWVADAMVAYTLCTGSGDLFDPAVGAGAFFRAGKRVAGEIGRSITLYGSELHSAALQEARATGLSDNDLNNVVITDFVLQPPQRLFRAIVANPPYIRHHRLPIQSKSELRSFGASLLGSPLDGRAGFHVYFLLRALQLLEQGGRLAFIMPADTSEGIFAGKLWRWITQRYRLDAVVTFSPEASPFPRVDTNPLIFMISNLEPKQDFLWAKCYEAQTEALKIWAFSDLQCTPSRDIVVCHRQLCEALHTGLSREPLSSDTPTLNTLGEFATVLRGIATGANEYFFLNRQQVASLGIPDEFLVPAIGRTRDVPGEEIDAQTIHQLANRGRPTLLFCPPGRPLKQLPNAVQKYLKQGESMGLPRRPLIASRRPWYKMEVRQVPPILFAYLGRRNARFVRNRAGVVPLTGFLCVYPRQDDEIFVEKLWEILRNPDTIARLSLVGKSYGAGAIKVEPRPLEALPLPTSLVASVGLRPPVRQTRLTFTEEG